MRKSPLVKALIAAALLAAAYLVGVYSAPRDWWPLPALRHFKRVLTQTEPAPAPEAAFVADERIDGFGRLAHFRDKQAIPCPAQTRDTMVLLLVGQSNAANSAGQRVSSAHGDKVVNYFAGQCTVAASPLLGATGISGESWTVLGNKLIASGLADRVILVPAAVASSFIANWREGPLNGMLLGTIGDAKSRYRITHVLWQQGEEDFKLGTTTEQYAGSFRMLAASIRQAGVDAPIFAAVSTRCRTNHAWTPGNPTAQALRSLADARNGVYPGIDSDVLGPADRYDDCHLSATGQEKFAQAWFEVLRKAR